VIVYRCAPNLCRINPDGSGQAQLTSDGATAAYHGGSLSHDGMRMAFTRDTEDLFVGDGSAQNPVGPISRTAQVAKISFDGTKVADVEDYTSAGYGFALCTFATTGSTDRSCGGTALFPSWTPDGQLVASQKGPGGNDRICVYVIASGGSGCQRDVAVDPASNLEESAVSPDGTTLAVIAVAPGSANSVAGHLVLYDMASGAPIRTLTSGSGDESPAWSPDGTRLVFARGGALFVIASTAAPGAEHQLVAGGDTPTWGGSDPTSGGGTPGAGGTPGGGGSVTKAKAKARCHTVIKRVHGKRRRVRVCTKPAKKHKKPGH
jgi:Tol biopolymer transport system component